MEKVLYYEAQDGDQVVKKQMRFKATAALALKYKEQFGSDLFKDLKTVQASWHKDGDQPGYFDRNADISIVYNIVWAMAKSANPDLPPPIEWFDSFEDGLPIWVWFAELSPMMTASFSGTAKNLPETESQQQQSAS